MFDDIFKRKKIIPERLAAYGFESVTGGFLYKKDILDGEFLLHVFTDGASKPDTKLFEKETGEEYILYKTDATGAYVGEIRSAIEEVLDCISDKCCENEIFKTAQAHLLTEHVRNTYGDELEFLWKKFPENAIWRRKDNDKWYGAILTVAGNKIGLDTSEIVEIVDLRMAKEKKEEILSRDGYLPGWHMNKNSWYTIVLDGTIPDAELIKRLEESYQLAGTIK